MGPISILIDEQQSRVTRPLMTQGADGAQWDFYKNDTQWICDPVTKTMMIRPTALTKQWQTNGTGAYARLRITDYQTAAGGSINPDAANPVWKENERRCPGDYFLESNNTLAVFTSTSWVMNRAFVLSFLVQQGQDYANQCLEFGWGELGAVGGVSVRVYTGGQAEVWKRTASDAAPVKVGDYSISGASVDVRRQNLGESTPLGDLAGKMVNLYVIPCRRRELLVFGTGGGGFSHVFADLPADMVNTITPAGRFWWRIPAGIGSVMCAPLIFPGTATVFSPVLTWREAPPAGAGGGITTYNDPPNPLYTSMIPAITDATGNNLFTFNGVNTQFRMRFTLTAGLGVGSTGGFTYTPFLYAAWAEIFTGKTNTTSAAKDITNFTQEVRLTVGDEPGGTSCRVQLVPGADAKPASDIGANITTRNNRPVRVTWGGKTLITGRTGKPKLIQAANLVPANKLGFDVLDDWEVLENIRYMEDRAPLDQLELTTALGLLLTDAGVDPAVRDIEVNTFRLASTTGASTGEWSYQPKVGDSVAQWLLKLWRDAAWDWYMGWFPTATGRVFRFRSEATLSALPKATIYLHRNGVAGRKACYAFEEEVIAPEATRVSVVGYDPRLKQILRATYANAALEDPTAPTVYGNVGEVRAVGLVEPRLTTAAAVVKGRDQLVNKLCVVQRIAEWQSDFLTDSAGVPLWRGDVVRIPGKGDYRIISFSGNFRHVPNIADWGLLKFNYLGKWIGPA